MSSTAVYKVHCKTFNVAQGITGKAANVSSYQGAFKPPYCLRIVKEHRTKEHQAFRNEIAKALRSMRTTTSTRLYHVVCVNEKTGRRAYMSRVNEPMTHKESCIFKSKMMQYEGIFYQLEEVNNYEKV